MTKTTRLTVLKYGVLALAAVSLATAAPALAQGRSLAPPAGTPMATTHLNPNTATEAQLRGVATLPADLRAALLRGRPYASPAAFHAAVGSKIPAAQQAAFYAAVWVPLNLNTATREEIMLVPGMSPRMAREFEEYRPYKDLEQFNREIGKYVDAAETARLRSYVTVR
jgi:DNA uptake protein ComE-like DNA-binding protein